MKHGALWGPSPAARLGRAFAKLDRAMVSVGAAAHDLTLVLYEIRAARLARIAA
jgi:hypothetical protein